MKNGTRIFLICLIIILLLGYVIGFVYCTVNKYASAEEISDNSILNFNQQITTQLNYSNSNVDNRDYFSFYLLFNNSIWKSQTINTVGYYDFILDIGTTTTGTLTIKHSGSTLDLNIYSQQYSAISGHLVYFRINVLGFNPSIVGGLKVTDFIAIDLTTMFGGNEPNLEQCRNLFVAKYYPYTSGTPITLNGYDQYSNALNDIFSNYKYMLDRNALSTQTQATNLMGTLSDSVSFGYNDENWYIKGAMYCPLFTKISAASEFNIEIQLYAPSGRDNRYLCFGTYVDNELNEIYKVSHNGDGTTLNINFNNQIDVQTLYVYQRNGSTNQIEEMNYIVGIFNIRVEQLDIAGAVMSSYSSGYNTARDYYSEGGQGFADIFARGKAAGLIEANGSFTAMDYVKTAFITIGEILMIEVFPNFTLGAFFLLPLLTSTIFFIVKLTRGGS